MIGYKQALAVCRTDPEATVRMLCEFSRELDRPSARLKNARGALDAIARVFTGNPFAPRFNTS
jgi:hypothetical protein